MNFTIDRPYANPEAIQPKRSLIQGGLTDGNIETACKVEANAEKRFFKKWPERVSCLPSLALTCPRDRHLTDFLSFAV
jgi:hypothetical protein